MGLLVVWGFGIWQVAHGDITVGMLLAAIAYITLVPMCIGNLAWFSIVGMLPAQVAGLSTIMVPMVAMVTGAAVRGEPLGPLQWAAMACCAGALWLALRPQGLRST